MEVGRVACADVGRDLNQTDVGALVLPVFVVVGVFFKHGYYILLLLSTWREQTLLVRPVFWLSCFVH